VLSYIYSSTILDLGTRWRRMVSFTSRPLYSRGNSPRYPLDRRLGGPQNWPGPCVVGKNLLSLPGIELRPSSPSISRLNQNPHRQQTSHNRPSRIIMLPREEGGRIMAQGKSCHLVDARNERMKSLENLRTPCRCPLACFVHSRIFFYSRSICNKLVNSYFFRELYWRFTRVACISRATMCSPLLYSIQRRYALHWVRRAPQ
jgi:hypothetical protein